MTGIWATLGVFTVAAALAVAVTVAVPPLALADLPGPRQECEAEGMGCETCWQHYGQSPEGAEAFAKCRDPLIARGLVEACRNRQGAGDAVFYCKPGVKVETETRGGGCAGCTVGAGEASGAVLALALGIGMLAMRRRGGGKGRSSRNKQLR